MCSICCIVSVISVTNSGLNLNNVGSAVLNIGGIMGLYERLLASAPGPAWRIENIKNTAIARHNVRKGRRHHVRKILDDAFHLLKNDAALDQEVELLTRIAYCAEGMFDCEINQNLGDAKDWKQQLKTATDKYYDFLFEKTGEQH